jgi:hypothetical protein
MDEERKPTMKPAWKENKEIFGRGKQTCRKQQGGQSAQTVSQITYGRRQVNHPRLPYNRSATHRHLGHNYNGRTEGSPPKKRPLNPQVSEFDRTARSS